jgi:uncharacterized protein (DUF1778 family)
MGTIGGIGNYFQLANLLSSGSGSGTLGQQPSGNPSLAQILDQSNSGGSSGGSNAFLLDLSPQAQQLLNGTASSSSASGSSSDFILTDAQQAAIKTIIAKYKDAPLTQDTFNAIQNALAAAGLSPQTLAAEDQVNSFNPTSVLLSALNGNFANLQNTANSASNEQTKESRYLQGIVKLWEAAAASSGSGSASSGGGTSA